jgi:putative RNA 2'-phosphotransferase
MKNDILTVSKFLSLVLRHQPEAIGLVLDAQGWADVDALIRLASEHGRPLTRSLLDQVVTDNDKKRFAFSADGSRIRASQGHSIEIELALPPAEPPELLYHGTATRFIESIRVQGLHSGSRQHVHLSVDVATAIKVGQRHGKPVVIVIRAGAMHRAGYEYFLSANSVWLTERVPVDFLQFPEASKAIR